MPFTSNEALPAVVRGHLPPHAQDIYRAAFNSAWEQWREDAVAHHIAWTAVKRSYVNDDDTWVPKSRPPVDPWPLAG